MGGRGSKKKAAKTTKVKKAVTASQQVFASIQALTPRGGGADASEIRKHFEAAMPDKDFNKEVLKLAEKYQVTMQRYDRPAMIPKEQRDKMVFDGEHYYNWISIRKD